MQRNADAACAVWRSRIPSQHDNNKRSIGLKLVVLARQMRQRFDQQAENIGLTSAKWTLIAVVARHPGATQRIIADMLEITEVTAGRLIDRLCADGYLRRTPHLSDRRAYCVEVTEAARPLLERLSEIGASCESELFAGFSAADVSQLETLLDAALGNLSDIKRRAQENASENAADSAEPAINASLPAEPAK